MTTKAPNKVIILSNTGFIGKVTFDYLQQRNTIPVFGYSSSSINLIYPDSLKILDNIIDEQTALILTAVVSPDRADTLDAFYTNITMVTNVARFLEGRRINKCIYISSVSVYGDMINNLSINENTPINPTSFYAIAKYTGELILQKVADCAGFPLLVLRLPRVYGPEDTHLLYGPDEFIHSVLQNRNLHLYGDGKELRDQLYIGDLVHLIHHFIFYEASGIYNLATGQSYSYYEIVEYLRRLSPYEFKVSHLPRTRPFANQRFDITKLSLAVPDFCFTELEKGLRETYDSFTTAIKPIH